MLLWSYSIDLQPVGLISLFDHVIRRSKRIDVFHIVHDLRETESNFRNIDVVMVMVTSLPADDSTMWI
ncbi:hypothetical protein PHET_00573 [Paragonimus heterotremus]|uniref:Uncharacterized protein n=1 Tax=Paragonimus heterotremus TaxID=100268 RepID=A0A8J4WKX4_9TREM|nr:hypothetical protein PHET_00573 [Paragonimus heterotremus]